MPSIEAPKEDWDKVIQACAMGSTERSQTCDRRRAICSASGWGPSRQQEMGRVKSGASGRGDAVGSLQQEMGALTQERDAARQEGQRLVASVRK